MEQAKGLRPLTKRNDRHDFSKYNFCARRRLCTDCPWLRRHGAQAQTPITGTGYNVDVVRENAGSNPNFANAFAGDPFSSWIEDGIRGYRGLPTEVGQDTTTTVLSAATNTVTGGHTTFEFQPYSVDPTTNGGAAYNVIQDTTGSGVIFTLSTAAAYTSLALDAASTDASATSEGTLMLHFANGSSSSLIDYNAFDWGNFSAHADTRVFANDLARAELDTTGYSANSNNTPIDTGNGNAFNMYETDINLASLGYGSSAISSITFYKAGDSSGTGIFGISGVPSAAPEPSQVAVMALIALGLGGLILRARKRPAADQA